MVGGNVRPEISLICLCFCQKACALKSARFFEIKTKAKMFQNLPIFGQKDIPKHLHFLVQAIIQD